ncbi:MAG TPA: catalase [Acidimicrobiia bacterium]|nr:catalase [Acidimicrobiia bacterium]
MPPRKKGPSPRSTRKPTRANGQQGAQGRLTEGFASEPVLVPRVSKVPAQDSDFLTTGYGQRLSHTDDSLKAGARGPTLMEDFHLREKVMHFDHERIPERVVHARGVGVHGVFEAYGNVGDLTGAGFLQPGRSTPVFVRFSTVAGSRGSADTVRDVRGFAVKFYTDDGIFDLVGNNMPVFFIRDGIKFPDLIHAAKPEPDREIPQAQTAHTTFWDFVSMIPESPHMLMWVMSDRAIPRSLRMMEGFGVHTFRLVNDAGDTTLVKFHWKPVLGVHGLVWDEAQTLAGVDPDFHRRDLYNAIGAGAFPQWELGIQVLPDTDDQRFEGIDLLDATKIVPEELAPVQTIGLMTLNRNPTNYFAETEQVAFHVGHLVRGIDVVDDPLLQARLFSYLDTQLTRLGGPNFEQIPINRTRAAVNDNLRDGSHQMAVHHGRTPYLPNAVGGGCPFLASGEDGGYEHVPRAVNGEKTRERGPDDEYTQATLFWNSMSEVEQDHLVDAFTFELGKVDVPAVVDRMVTRLALVDRELAQRVGVGLGLRVDAPSRNGRGGRADQTHTVDSSPALAMVTEEPWPIDGRVVHVLAADGADLGGIDELREMLVAAGVAVQVVATHKGAIVTGDRELTVDRSFHTSSSAEADAIVVAGGAALADDPIAQTYVQSAYRHHKTIGAWGDGVALLAAAGCDDDAPGVIVGEAAGATLAEALVAALARHRHWERAATHPTRELTGAKR